MIVYLILCWKEFLQGCSRPRCTVISLFPTVGAHPVDRDLHPVVRLLQVFCPLPSSRPTTLVRSTDTLGLSSGRPPDSIRSIENLDVSSGRPPDLFRSSASSLSSTFHQVIIPVVHRSSAGRPLCPWSPVFNWVSVRSSAGPLPVDRFVLGLQTPSGF